MKIEKFWKLFLFLFLKIENRNAILIFCVAFFKFFITTPGTELQGGGDHGGPLCGMVFKIVHHPQKGPLCFVRIYAGHLTQRQVIIQHPQKGPLCFVRIYAGHLTQRQVIIQHP